MQTCFKNISLLLILLLYSNWVVGADDIATIPSSQPSYYGTLNTSLFTGRLSYAIPIYTVEDPDFHLDISLRYNAEGFKPFSPSGICGKDWLLVAGGGVTRIVQGLPDDQKISHYENSYWEYSKLGMTYAMQEGITPDKYQVFNFDGSVCDTCGVSYFQGNPEHCDKYQVDYLPDVFYADFCGHKGRFIINNKGKASVLSGNFAKIDISQMRDSDAVTHAGTDSHPCAGSQITIWTQDGYKYVFGGNSAALEYLALTQKNANLAMQNTPYVSTWHLTQITAPNGRTMTFSYYPSGESYVPLKLRSFYTDYDWSKRDTALHITYSLRKECVLQSIVTSDSVPLRVSFITSPESSKMYDHSDFSYCAPHLQLDTIRISYADNILRTVDFSYLYRSYEAGIGATPNYNWRFLRQVSISGIGTYSMTYEHLNPYQGLPPQQQPLHWYPELYPKTNGEYQALVDRFGFWKQSSLQGMLRNISLPTGGMIKFTYGNHQYAEERLFRIVGNQNVELYTRQTSNHAIGGARIEKIETFLEDSTLVERKQYSYLKQGTDNSSGIFYNFHEIFYPNDMSNGNPIANPQTYGMVDSHIGYSYVVQTTTSGNQTFKTAYTYDTGITDYSSAGNPNINRRTDITGYSDSAEVSSGSLTYPERLTVVGNLLAVEEYKGNTIARYTLYKYNGIPNQMQGMPSNQEPSLGCTDTIVVLSTYSGLVARKLFVYPDVLEQVVTHDLDNNDNAFVQDETFTFDRNLRQKKVTTTDSRGIKHFTCYTYPDDIATAGLFLSQDSPAVCFLVKSHRINIPIETVTGYVEMNTEYITGAVVNLYDKHMYIQSVTRDVTDPNPQEPIGVIQYLPYLSKTLSLSLKSPITDYQPAAMGEDSVSYDHRFRPLCEYRFDAHNRPLYIKRFGKPAVSYVWTGNSNLYPSSIVTGNQTYTYTYLPYVGITSCTDPRGITTYYTYDSAGKLVEEYQMIDGKKRILNAYQYHFKTE